MICHPGESPDRLIRYPGAGIPSRSGVSCRPRSPGERAMFMGVPSGMKGA